MSDECEVKGEGKPGAGIKLLISKTSMGAAMFKVLIRRRIAVKNTQTFTTNAVWALVSNNCALKIVKKKKKEGSYPDYNEKF